MRRGNPATAPAKGATTRMRAKESAAEAAATKEIRLPAQKTVRRHRAERDQNQRRDAAKMNSTE